MSDLEMCLSKHATEPPHCQRTLHKGKNGKAKS